MNWIEAEKKYIFHTYKRQPLILVKGKGAYVWDIKHKKYLDFFKYVLKESNKFFKKLLNIINFQSTFQK